MIGIYKVITLCGSTKFKEQFMQVQKELTLKGNIILSVGLFGHSGDMEVWDNKEEGFYGNTKTMLDDMHKRKIDISDEIFVINVNGYIGEGTKSEIEYAMIKGKKVNYLVQPCFLATESAMRIEEEPEISEEDLKHLRDIANSEVINRFKASEIKVGIINHTTKDGE